MNKFNAAIPFLSLAILISAVGINYYTLQKFRDQQTAQDAVSEAWRQEADKIIRQPRQVVTAAAPVEPAKVLSLPEMTDELVKRRAKLDEELATAETIKRKADDEMAERKASALSTPRRDSTASTLDTFRSNPVADFLPKEETKKSPIPKKDRESR